MWRDVHTTETDDGFLLTLVNIMGTQDTNKQDKSKAKPVLLMHGSRTNFYSFFEKTDDSLPSVPERLANDGYDVYLY